MKTLFDDVKAFLRKFCGRTPEEVLGARRRMVAEEALEFDEALASGDRAKIAHEGIDLIYSTIGGLVEAGISPEQALRAWGEVARANAAKVVEPGKWKAQKPAGWRPPDVAAALRAGPACCLCGDEEAPWRRLVPVAVDLSEEAD